MNRILSLLLVFAGLSVNGQVTHLDSSFNQTGILTLHLKGGQDYLGVLLTRPDGKSLEIGKSYFANRTPAVTLEAITIVQFDANGSPDPTFGQEGVVVIDYLQGDATVLDASLQEDGKLLIAGYYPYADNGPYHFIIRLNEDGTLDTSFGQMGISSHPDPIWQFVGTSLAVQPDGKIVLGGFEGFANQQMFIIRFHADGLVDSTFGNNGVVFSDEIMSCSALDISADGWIYAGGVSMNYEAILLRYTNSGVLDTGFGSGGSVKFSDAGSVDHVLVQSDGKIVVAGGVNGFIVRLTPEEGAFDPNFDDFSIVGDFQLLGIALHSNGSVIGVLIRDIFEVVTFRYWPNGQLDPNFGGGFYSDVPIEPALSLQPDGKIMLGGLSFDDFGFRDFCIIRLTENAALDTLYAQNGVATQDVGKGYSGVNSILMDDANNLLIGGDLTYTNQEEVPVVSSTTGFLSRFHPDGSLDASYWQNGLKSLPNTFVLRNLFARQSDGKVIAAGGANKDGGYLAVARMLPDGQFDTTFGPPFGNGSSFCELFSLNIYEAYAKAVAISPDKAILLFSETVDLNGLRKLAIVRFDSTGLLDQSFGVNGVLLTSSTLVPGNFELKAGLVQPDGKILLGGTYGIVPNIFLLRFMPDGSMDTTFGINGRLFKPFASSFFHLNGLALESGGQILITGSQGTETSSNVFAGRLNPDGTRDISFNEDGLLVLNVGAVESGYAIAVDLDNKVVIAGKSSIAGAMEPSDPLFVRLQSDGNLDTSFAGMGYVITDLPGNNQLNALAVQPDGHYLAGGYSDNNSLLVRYLHELSVGVIDPSVTLSEVLIYPNPVWGSVAVTYTLRAPSRVSIELFNAEGRLCHQFLMNEIRFEGEQEENIYFPTGFVPGIYLLRITTDDGQKSVRVFIP